MPEAFKSIDPWMQTAPKEFVAEASMLGIRPGQTPDDYALMLPTGQRPPHRSWQKHTAQESITHWTTMLNGVLFTIFND